MTWTQPKTWTSEPLTSADLNIQLRDNLEALKDPPSASYAPQETSDYTTTSAVFVDVDATNLALTIETNGGDVLIGFHGAVKHTGNYRVAFDVSVDAGRLGGDEGIVMAYAESNEESAIAFARLVSGLSVGSHTVTLQWKLLSGTSITLLAGAGTSNSDVIPQFWVREVS